MTWINIRTTKYLTWHATNYFTEVLETEIDVLFSNFVWFLPHLICTCEGLLCWLCGHGAFFLVDSQLLKCLFGQIWVAIGFGLHHFAVSPFPIVSWTCSWWVSTKNIMCYLCYNWDFKILKQVTICIYCRINEYHFQLSRANQSDDKSL